MSGSLGGQLVVAAIPGLPALVFVILAFVVVNAKVAAQVLAILWIALGVVVLLSFKAMNRRLELAGLEEE